jgi:hypothetical protein
MLSNSIFFLCKCFGIILVVKSCVPCVLQSGKSAATYACAQEQGFEVLEVLLKLYVFVVEMF